ncbi:hypothetical protein [Azospirillum palustre]
MRHTLSANRDRVARWNYSRPTGADVTYRPAIGQPIATVTASEAHMVGVDAVVILMGHGRVLLDRVTPA